MNRRFGGCLPTRTFTPNTLPSASPRDFHSNTRGAPYKVACPLFAAGGRPLAGGPPTGEGACPRRLYRNALIKSKLT
ncbi:hypothetical protein EVAR_14809_1 [Eumeta japonica]|uniref:Uncharacterized protein n=1 Tax=Eumeta variegata TaxID=151549 RepID=A0A4C1TX09_EUMVA|nr:hypothetical protein EVAR_14809_1 [Eumeta japonica]